MGNKQKRKANARIRQKLHGERSSEAHRDRSLEGRVVVPETDAHTARILGSRHPDEIVIVTNSEGDRDLVLATMKAAAETDKTCVALPSVAFERVLRHSGQGDAGIVLVTASELRKILLAA